MIRSRGDAVYRLMSDTDARILYACLRAEGVLWALFPDHLDMTEEQFVSDVMRPDVWSLGGWIGCDLAGCLTVRAFNGANTLCAEVGVTARRMYFQDAPWLCRGALLEAAKQLGIRSFVGRVAVTHHHVLRMLEAVGFERLCRIPGMIYHARKDKYVDGWLVGATPESIRATEGV